MKKDAKRFILWILLFLQAFSLTLPAPGYADNDTMWTKFGRGAANLVLAPAEIYIQISNMSKQQRWPIAFFGGFSKGIYYTTRRMLVGMYEMFTFPSPGSTRYGPLIKPELPFPKWE